MVFMCLRSLAKLLTMSCHTDLPQAQVGFLQSGAQEICRDQDGRRHPCGCRRLLGQGAQGMVIFNPRSSGKSWTWHYDADCADEHDISDLLFAAFALGIERIVGVWPATLGKLCEFATLGSPLHRIPPRMRASTCRLRNFAA